MHFVTIKIQILYSDKMIKYVKDKKLAIKKQFFGGAFYHFL